MICYFRDLLTTLHRIERHLETIASSVRNNPRHHGQRHYLSMGHWND